MTTIFKTFELGQKQMTSVITPCPTDPVEKKIPARIPRWNGIFFERGSPVIIYRPRISKPLNNFDRGDSFYHRPYIGSVILPSEDS